MMGEMSLIDTKQTFVKTRISVFQRNYFRITYGYVSNTVCLANVQYQVTKSIGDIYG